MALRDNNNKAKQKPHNTKRSNHAEHEVYPAKINFKNKQILKINAKHSCLSTGMLFEIEMRILRGPET